MLNIQELEERHKKYKFKSQLPFVAISALAATIIIGVVSFTIFYQKDSVPDVKKSDLPTVELNTTTVATTPPPTEHKIEEKVEKKEEEKIEKKVEEKNETTPAIQTPKEVKEEIKTTPKVQKEHETEEKPKRIVLTPSIDFISSTDKQTTQSRYPTINSTSKEKVTITEEIVTIVQEEKKPSTVPEEKKEESVKPTIKEKVESTTQKEEKKGSISIAHRDEQRDIEDVIKRFNVSHNPALSLFVAKKYYQLGNYEQAYNYALATNDINNNIEESWIIFAKSLVKLNKKAMAVETLKKYISHSGSSQARQLLDEINSGKFK
ncbi:MAG: hypothetical protein OEL19_10740 [Sulfurimonas sp.]|nr:hypothetical protein [Sulfurimonas sp.]